MVTAYHIECMWVEEAEVEGRRRMRWCGRGWSEEAGRDRRKVGVEGGRRCGRPDIDWKLISS